MVVKDWKDALDNKRDLPNTPLPPSFMTFLLLAKLSNYGIKLSMYDIEHLDSRLVMEWFIIMSHIQPEDINAELAIGQVKGLLSGGN